jgi:hypothetical protein
MSCHTEHLCTLLPNITSIPVSARPCRFDMQVSTGPLQLASAPRFSTTPFFMRTLHSRLSFNHSFFLKYLHLASLASCHKSTPKFSTILVAQRGSSMECFGIEALPRRFARCFVIREHGSERGSDKCSRRSSGWATTPPSLER